MKQSNSSVDEKVLEMRFDNAQFEKNIQTTIHSLKEFNNSLDLKNATKGLENVRSAAQKCDISGISDGVDVVIQRFSYMQMTIQHMLNNIVDSAFYAGKKLVSSLTIDPISTGFQEYETQINSIQTILANTESKGSTLEDVNSALDELNHYADMTIYNFTEMTRNIGTFTAAGIDLETSVSAIKGIANLAAVSGSTSQQASTAMYQLSQALASGTVKLQDWNSVVNAGMGGQVFQDALKETARLHGVAIDSMIKKEGSFRETLKDGWLTASVLTETLSKFTGDLTESQLSQMGYTADQVKSIIKMGQTANDAATKVKTLTQLFDTLQEAAQSGWTQTWQLIVGDFDEAKDLFTSLSDSISDFLNKSSERRNSLLEEALLDNWGKLTKGINEAGIETKEFEASLRNVLTSQGRNVDTIISNYGSLEKAAKRGMISTNTLKEALYNLNSDIAGIELLDRLFRFGDSGDEIKRIQEALASLDFDIGNTGADGIFGSRTQEAIRAFQETHGLSVDGIIGPETLNMLKEAASTTGKISDDLYGLADSVRDPGGRELLIDSFANISDAFNSILKPIKNAYREIFDPLSGDTIKNIIEKFHAFTEGLRINDYTADKINRTFKGTFSALNLIKKGFTAIISPIGKFMGNGGLKGLGDIFITTTANIGDFISALSESESVTALFSKISDGIYSGLTRIRTFFDEKFGDVQTLDEFFIKIKNIAISGIESLLDELSVLRNKLYEKLSSNEDIAALLSTISNGLSTLKTKMVGLIPSNMSLNFEKVVASLKNMFAEFKKNHDINALISNVLNSLKNVPSQLGEAFSSFRSLVSDKLTSAGEILTNFYTTAKEKFVNLGDKITSVKETISDALSTLVSNLKTGIEWLNENVFNNKLKTGLALFGLYEIVKKIKSIITAIQGFFKKDGSDGVGDAITNFVDNISNSVKAFTTSVKTAVIVEIAAAVLFLAIAMKQISSIDNVETSLMALGVILTELGVFMSLTNKTSAIQGGIGALALVLSFNKIINAISKIGQMDTTQLTWGLIGLGAALTEITIVFSRINSTKAVASGAGVLLVALSLNKIAKALSSFSQLTDPLAGLIGMGAALTELSVIIGALSKFGGDPYATAVASGSILALTSGLDDIASALKTIGEMSWDDIAAGLVGMGGALAELTIAIGVLGSLGSTGVGLVDPASSSGLFGTLGSISNPTVLASGSILALTSGLDEISSALSEIGELSWADIAAGLVGMGGALTELAVVAGLLGNLGGSAAVLGSASILIGVQGLGDLANALVVFGSMEWEEIARGLTAMGGALAETAIGGIYNSLSGLGAESIATIAAPLGDLADSVTKWTDITVPEGIGAQLKSLASGIKKFNFTNSGAASISEIAEPMGTLADSMAKWADVTIPEGLGAQIGTLGKGVRKFNFSRSGAGSISEIAEPMGTLADSMAKWADVVVPEGLGAQLGAIGKGIKKFNFSKSGAGSVSEIAEPMGTLADSMAKWSDVIIPEGLGDQLTLLAPGIKAFNFSGWGVENISVVAEPMGILADSLAKWSGMVIPDNLASTLTSLAEVSNAFSGLYHYDITQISEALDGLLDGLLSRLDTDSSERISSFSDGISGLCSSISSLNLTSDTNNFGANFLSGLLNSLTDASNAASATGADISNAGESVVIALSNSISHNVSLTTEAMNSILSSMLDTLDRKTSDFYNTGYNLLVGFVNGIYNNISLAATAAAKMAESAKDAAKMELDEHSPSKEFFNIGDFAGVAFVNALLTYVDRSRDAGSSIAKSAKMGLQLGISKAMSAIDTSFTISPTIRPILDLSLIQNEANQIGGIIGSTRTVGLNANLSAISAGVSNKQYVNDNTDVINAINRLQRSISEKENNSYVINGITYDDGSNINNAVKALTQAIRMERRG